MRRRLDRVRAELAGTARALAMTLREHAKAVRRSATLTRDRSRRKLLADTATQTDERAAMLERYALELLQQPRLEEMESQSKAG